MKSLQELELELKELELRLTEAETEIFKLKGRIEVLVYAIWKAEKIEE